MTNKSTKKYYRQKRIQNPVKYLILWSFLQKIQKLLNFEITHATKKKPVTVILINQVNHQVNGKNQLPGNISTLFYFILFFWKKLS